MEKTENPNKEIPEKKNLKEEKQEILEVKQTEKNEENQKKSNFEKLLIDAFKEKKPLDCLNKLNNLLEETPNYIMQMKELNGNKSLINKNILDKFNRIIERKYLIINITIAKIYNCLLETSNYYILSNEINLLISFSNSILNILEIVSKTNISKDLEKKFSSFLNYLNTNTNFTLEEEQEEIIKELITSFPMKNNSDSYIDFPYRKKMIIRFCESDSEDDKLEGLINLFGFFNQTFSLNEQYDMLLEHCNQIIKSIINKPNENYRKIYYELGHFILNLLYNYKFVIKTNFLKDEKQDTLFFCDFISNQENNYYNIKLKNCNDNLLQLNFLNDTFYELTEQKEILLKCENIFSISLLVLNTLIIYEKFFDLQIICFEILKNIYFVFPQFRKIIEDLLVTSLINLCTFKTEDERKSTINCRQFINYLLKLEGNEELKGKLKEKIELNKDNINIDLNENEIIENNLIEYNNLDLKNIYLKTGYPLYFKIDAGSESFKYIEIDNPNSLVYIAYSVESYDITFSLFRYCSNSPIDDNKIENENLIDNNHFVELLKFTKLGEVPVKILIFVKEPGIYKIIFDNSYSWFTGKEIRCRINILKPLSEIKIQNENQNKNNNDNNKRENSDVFINI